MDVGDIFGLLGCCREPDLGRCGEVRENLPPCRIVGRAPAMALINHDQVKKPGENSRNNFCRSSGPVMA